MTIPQLIMLVSGIIIIAIIIVALLVKRDNVSNLYFNKRNKRFRELPKNSTIPIPAYWHHISQCKKGTLDKFNKFIKDEKYNITTYHQALNVYVIYIETCNCNFKE